MKGVPGECIRSPQVQGVPPAFDAHSYPTRFQRQRLTLRGGRSCIPRLAKHAYKTCIAVGEGGRDSPKREDGKNNGERFGGGDPPETMSVGTVAESERESKIRCISLNDGSKSLAAAIESHRL